MTPGQHVPLTPWATRIIQSPVQRDATRQLRANRNKAGASSDWGLQLALMKLESLVIAGQLYRGEYVLKSCTHNKRAQQRIHLYGLNPYPLFVTGEQHKGRHISARSMPEGPDAKNSLCIKRVDRPTSGG